MLLVAEQQQTRASKFGDAVLWGAGFAIGSLIIGGLLKWSWSAISKTNDETDELDELDEAEE